MTRLHLPLPKSIATVSLSGTLPEKLEAAAAIGFDGVEIFENDLLTFDGSPEDVRELAVNLGLTITCFQPFRDFEAMPAPQRARNMDRAERKFDVMQALGCDLLMVCSNVSPLAINDDARAAADLAEMAERADKRGLRVCYEALAWGRHVNRWRHAWKIVREGNHPALGLLVDSFHTLALNDDPSGIADVPAGKLFFVQLADAPRLSMDVLSWSRHFRNFPGQGQLPVTDFVRAVLASGYRGPLSLEIFNDEFRAAPARLTARDGLRSLLMVEAEAGGTVLPPPPVFDGVEFLEFAVDDEHAIRLGETLRGLGFHHAGRHRSKSVDLYRQGRVNLILNSEPDSAASEHFQFHGSSVCAMALRVDDAAAAIERANGLLCPEWRERIGQGERRIPAVRAPDGTLVYLVQPDPSGRTIYDDDFILTSDPAPDALVTGIDHVAQALPMGRMDNFVLFYHAVFGFAGSEIQSFENAARDGADHAAVFNHQTMFHRQYPACPPPPKKRRRGLEKCYRKKVNRGFRKDLAKSARRQLHAGFARQDGQSGIDGARQPIGEERLNAARVQGAVRLFAPNGFFDVFGQADMRTARMDFEGGRILSGIDPHHAAAGQAIGPQKRRVHQQLGPVLAPISSGHIPLQLGLAAFQKAGNQPPDLL